MNPSIKEFYDKKTATWTYIVYDLNNKKCAIIDPVLDFDIYSGRTSHKSADLIINFVIEQGLQVEWIVETHIHADHLTSSRYLKEELGGKTGISKHILKILKTWRPILDNANDTPLDGSQFDHLFEDNEEFNIGNLKAKIIHTPGHTPADTSYVIGDCIFAGDSIFMPDIGTGRCDFPDGDAEDSYNSTQKLLSFPDEFKIYVGHDYPPRNRKEQSHTSVKEQKINNVRVNHSISKDEYIANRNKDDIDKPVPKLLLPSIQVNLRAGEFCKNSSREKKFIKIPVDII